MGNKLLLGHGKVTPHGFSVELNFDRLMEFFKLPEVQDALKRIPVKGGETNRIILMYLTELDEEHANKYQSHSLRINTDYRQG